MIRYMEEIVAARIPNMTKASISTRRIVDAPPVAVALAELGGVVGGMADVLLINGNPNLVVTVGELPDESVPVASATVLLVVSSVVDSTGGGQWSISVSHPESATLVGVIVTLAAAVVKVPMIPVVTRT